MGPRAKEGRESQRMHILKSTLAARGDWCRAQEGLSAAVWAKARWGHKRVLLMCVPAMG